MFCTLSAAFFMYFEELFMMVFFVANYMHVIASHV